MTERIHLMQQRYAAVFSAVAEGAVVVAASRRLARALQLEYAQWCVSKGQALWATPRIVTADAWFGGLWKTQAEFALSGLIANESRRCLTLPQERVLWERIVADSSRGDVLLNVPAAAALAMAAWRLAHQWRLLPREWAGPVSEDNRVFAEWAESFEMQLRARGVVTQAQLPDLLAPKLDALRDHFPSQVWWLGFDFDVLPPQWRRLADALTALGVSSRCGVVANACAAAHRVVAHDGRDELIVAARWARARLDDDPARRLAVVVLDLEQRRNDVERIFTDILAPGGAVTEHPGDGIFNLSLGLPLSTTPLVRDALTLLEAVGNGGVMPSEAFGALLLSPFVGTARNDDDELALRAQWDRALRERGEAQINMADAQSVLRIDATRPAFADDVGRLATLIVPLSETRSWRQWIAYIHQALSSAGWPGARPLSSVEEQQRQAWIDVLEQLTELDMVAPAPRFTTAVAQLRRLAGEQVFQPESAPAPLQILGAAQTAGLCFDEIWVAGSHDEALPETPRVSPFLPATLLRQRGVPGASAAAALQLAQHRVAEWRANASQVIFSHAAVEADRALNVSAIVRDATVAPSVPQSTSPLWSSLIAGQLRGDTRAHDAAPLPLAQPTATSKGGAWLFRDQAACPFRAFARYRLGAEALPAYRAGWEAYERGNIVHDVLRDMWSDLRDSLTLASVTDDDLQARVARLVRAVVKDAAERRPQLFTPRFMALETQRLIAGVTKWLEVEKERTPFRVEACEREYDMRVGPLTVRGRIDRVDRLEDDTCAVLDYKTGDTKVASWFGRRPEEPQLPVYAVAAVAETSSLAFVEVKPGGMTFKGIACDTAWARGVKPFAATKFSYDGSRGWAEQLVEWRTDLSALAQEFVDGIRSVTPRDGLKTCTYCDLQVLCRVYEQKVLAPAETEEQDESSDE